VRVLPEARSDFHDDEVLVELRIGLRDFAFAERIIKRAVDRLRGNAEARGRRPVDHDVCGQALDLLVTVDVGQLVDLLHRGEQRRRPLIELR
jgi:hypothetical protein